MTSTRWIGTSLAAALVAVAGACGRGDAGSDTTATVAAATGTSTPAAAPATPGALGDAEIAHVAVTANAIDSTLGATAERKAGHAEVKAFARRMQADHGGVNAQAVALAGRLGVTPADNDVSRSLQQGATAATDSLAGLSGPAFDRAYIAREVAYHAAVLDALDGTLIPGASNGELKALLQQVRPAIAAHLDLARQIQGKLP